MLVGESLSFLFGVLSNILWFIILIPQVYMNYKLKNADAFSFSLVFMWIVGDLFSILSSNAKGLPPIILYSAVYHMTLALLFMIQILYYRSYNLNKSIQLRSEEEDLLMNDEVDIIDIEEDNEQEDLNQVREDYIRGYDRNVEDIDMFNSHILTVSNEPAPLRTLVRDNKSVDYDNMFLLTIEEQLFILISMTVMFMCWGSLSTLHGAQKIFIADLIGWASTFIFISSRIPQIYLNYTRGSVEGLSLNSFILINIANYLFVSSILVNLYDIPSIDDKFIFFVNNIQWIMGSFCTSFFDAIIFYQFITYK